MKRITRISYIFFAVGMQMFSLSAEPKAQQIRDHRCPVEIVPARRGPTNGQAASHETADEAARRRLVGTWYLNGDRNKPCQIFGGGFEAKNERGESTRLVYVRVRDHREHPNGSHPNGSMFIRASDWGDLRGEVHQYFQGEVHQSIEWANGTRWTRFR